jgi:hypothetical protein
VIDKKDENNIEKYKNMAKVKIVKVDDMLH